MKKWIFGIIFLLFLIMILYVEAYDIIFLFLLVLFPFIIYLIKTLFDSNKGKIFLIIFIILSIIGIFLYFGYYEVALGILVMLMPFVDSIFILGIGFLFYYIGKNIGKDKARKELKKEILKLNLENPYIYFRDIPNKYGIGVSAILLNYKLNKEDLLAGILDLCAKGYINLKQIDNKCEIQNNNKDKSMLLSNEIYLLNWVINKDKINFSYKEWISLCKNDAIMLGLANKSEEVKYKELINFDTVFAKKLIVVSFILAFLAIEIFDLFIAKNIFIIESIFMAIFLTFPLFFILFFILMFIALIYEGKILAYKAKKENILVLTEFGKNEYYELVSLGKFLNDFGRFAEKHVEEIIIWEQYLSYAIMYRLGNKILKTGYEKLRINESFIINDLDKIVL